MVLIITVTKDKAFNIKYPEGPFIYVIHNGHLQHRARRSGSFLRKGTDKPQCTPSGCTPVLSSPSDTILHLQSSQNPKTRVFLVMSYFLLIGLALCPARGGRNVYSNPGLQIPYEFTLVLKHPRGWREETRAPALHPRRAAVRRTFLQVQSGAHV